MKVYARIKNNKIVEYPIYDEHITNRNLSLNELVVVKKPLPPSIKYDEEIIEDVKTDGDEVWVEFRVRKLPPYKLLAKAQRDNNEEMIIKAFTLALDNLLDRKAQEKGYDNRVTCSLRAGYPGPFQQEGIAFAQWMDQCYQLGYQILNDVKAGLREPPQTIEEFLSELPDFQWPE